MCCAAYTSRGAHGERSWEVMPSRMRRRPKAHTGFRGWFWPPPPPERPRSLPSPTLPRASHPPPWRLGVASVLDVGGSDPATVQDRPGRTKGTPVLPPASPCLLGHRSMCQDGGAERIRPLGCAGRTWGNRASMSPGFGFIVRLVGCWVLIFRCCCCLSPAPFPLFFLLPSEIFFFRLSCWPPCLPYGWGYLRRISQRIAP